MESFIPER
jgi:hypothetical protein